MAYDDIKALRLTPYFALKAGWLKHLPKVSAVLGFDSRYPTVKEFVRAVSDWQRLRPTLKADGVLGPRTWKMMESEVLEYAGQTPAGVLPDWILKFWTEKTIEDGRQQTLRLRKVLVNLSQRGKFNPPPCRQPKNADEQLFAEMDAVSKAQKIDPYLPHEISATVAVHVAKASLPSVQASSLPGWSLVGVQTITVGQVWPGLKSGHRIVVALTPTFDVHKQFGCNVVWVSDSGRIYQQSGIGWVHDYETVLINDLDRKLAPLRTLLEAQAAFLVGALAAYTGFFAAISIIGLTWCINPANQRTVVRLADGLVALMVAREVLKSKAPKLYDKVFWAVLGGVLSELPSATLKDTKISAMMIGQIIWTVGTAVLSRRADMVCDGLQVVAKVAASTLAGTARRVAQTVGAAAGKAVPGAAAQAARTASGRAIDEGALALAQALADAGIRLTDRDAVAVHDEVRRDAKVVKDAIDKVLAALEALITDLSAVET